MILAIKTDQPKAELLLIDEAGAVKSQLVWQAHRELSNTLLQKTEELLKAATISASDLTGIIVFQGPGSFTGLRIGITFANTLAYTMKLPISAGQSEGWIEVGLQNLSAGGPFSVVMPEYGAPAHITTPRK